MPHATTQPLAPNADDMRGHKSSSRSAMKVVSKPPYATIGGIAFKNKTEVRKHYSTVINAHERGHTLDGQDLAFVADLLKRHRSYGEKAGAGVARFYVTRHAVYGTKKIEFERVDGTIDDFSINYCLDPVSESEYARMNFLCAARTTVLPDIRAFKNSSGMICAVTSEKHSRDDLHVDHAPPNVFSAIASKFLASRGKQPLDFEYLDDSAGLAIFADTAVANDFRQHHAKQATLRVIHKSINLSGGTWGI
jgi:hypothetical protein